MIYKAYMAMLLCVPIGGDHWLVSSKGGGGGMGGVVGGGGIYPIGVSD